MLVIQIQRNTNYSLYEKKSMYKGQDSPFLRSEKQGVIFFFRFIIPSFMAHSSTIHIAKYFLNRISTIFNVSA